DRMTSTLRERSTDAFELSRRLITPALQTSADRLDAGTRQVCRYHLGFVDEQGRETSSNGRGVRPALAVLTARAAGAPAEEGVPAGVACELVHNFSLLHDDVMDGDTERRHRATAWSLYGGSAAILAGDALQSLACEVLAEVPCPTSGW